MPRTTPLADVASPTRKSRRRRSAIAVAAAGCTLLAACGSGSGSGAASNASATSTKKVPLVLYAAEGYDAAMGKAFQKATGIPVKVDDNSTGPLITKVEAEKNNPQWDLMWTDGATEYAEFDRQGLLLRGFKPKANYDSLGKSLVPKNNSFHPTGVTMAAAVVYNTKTVSNPPTSWSQLTSSKWKGKVGMNDPSVSGPTYPYVAGMAQHLGGEAQGKAFFSKLKANGLHIYQTNTNTLQALETGTIHVATIQSSAGIGAGLSNKHIKVTYADPETVLPSVLGIDAKISPEARKEAEQFVNYVLSPKGQKVMQSGDPTGDSLFWPVINGVKPLAALPPISSVPTQTIDPYIWGPRENGFNSWFTDKVVR